MTEATGLRERKRQATRSAIVRAATELFLDRGFTATSVADIAAAAGVSRRTFFLYFPAKEDVLFHHIEAHIQLALDSITALAPDATAWEAVQAAMNALVDAVDVTAAGADELADLRREFIRSAGGFPGSLMVRLRSVHTTLLEQLKQHFPDQTGWPVITAHLGACLGATAAIAAGTPAARRRAAMREAIRRAGVGFIESP
ncbi:TetR family transcriptional regulator [Nocardia sp. NPDC052316]|uniref:TetR family transcriptional regulator n=1 Tax=Nocardia sp. NPDC052316 TaxID=3364329 RepID=UPI0037C9C359